MQVMGFFSLSLSNVYLKRYEGRERDFWALKHRMEWIFSLLDRSFGSSMGSVRPPGMGCTHRSGEPTLKLRAAFIRITGRKAASLICNL